MPPRERDSKGKFVSSREPESSEDVDSESIEDTNERDEPGERSESTAGMAPQIPEAKEAKPTKLVQFDIPNLTKQNVRTWKSDVQEFCETQGVWEVVE